MAANENLLASTEKQLKGNVDQSKLLKIPSEHSSICFDSNHLTV